MKLNIGKIFFALTLLMASVSCATDSIKNPDDLTDRKTVFDDFVLKQSTIYFGEERGKYCEVVDINTVIIKSDIPEALMPKVGEVVFVPLSESVPDGFMGKVNSVSDAGGDFLVKTQEVSLDEVFEELHIDKTISISKLMDKVLDEDGNLIECGILPDEVWGDTQHVMDSLSMLQPQPVPLTKAEFVNSQTYTRSIPFKYKEVSGEFVLSASLSVKLDISKGRLQEYDINLSKKSFIRALVGIENEGETEIPILTPKTFELPFSFNVGPIVLKPVLVYSLDFLASGKIKFGANIGIGLEDVSTRWHNGETITTFGEGNQTYIGADYLDAEGSFGLKTRVALQFGVFGQKFLAFGIDAIPSANVGLSGTLGMDDKELLKSDLKAELSLNCSCGLYMYCKLFSSDDDNLRASVEMPGRTWELGIFDKGSGFNVKKSSGEWSVSGSFGDRQFMSVDEKGIALFREGDDENPVEMQMMFSKTPGSSVKAADSSEGTEVTFKLPDNTSGYELRPYNLVRSEYGEYCFFGDKLVTSKLRKISNSEMSVTFLYDTGGRLDTAKYVDSYGTITYSYSYTDTRIVCKLGMDGSGRYEAEVDKNGRLIYGDVGDYSYNVSYNGNSPSFHGIQNFSDNFLIYGNGNQKSMDEMSFSYGSDPDIWNIDVFTSIFVNNFVTPIILPFHSFNGIHNRNLCTGITDSYGYTSINYTFDADGNVSGMSVGDTKYRFEYLP